MTDLERFARIRRLVGEERFEKLRSSNVTVVGLGAVGSYAVEALARSGVGKLTLIDFDRIQKSNINRQLYALTDTIGQLKCDVARERVLQINPDCEVVTLPCFLRGRTLGRPSIPACDFTIDAIDSLAPKSNLLMFLLEEKIPFISAAGAAMRTDPSRIKIGPLEDVTHCKLAFRVRKNLRRNGFSVKFPCVYSDEIQCEMVDQSEFIDGSSDMGVGKLEERESGNNPVESVSGKGSGSDRVRERQPMGSLSTITGIFGLIAANYTINHLTG